MFENSCMLFLYNSFYLYNFILHGSSDYQWNVSVGDLWYKHYIIEYCVLTTMHIVHLVLCIIINWDVAQNTLNEIAVITSRKTLQYIIICSAWPVWSTPHVHWPIQCCWLPIAGMLYLVKVVNVAVSGYAVTGKGRHSCAPYHIPILYLRTESEFRLYHFLWQPCSTCFLLGVILCNY